MTKNHHVLLEELRTLETELHTNETRTDLRRMDTLLHRDFIEFGRSGKRYTRAEILTEFGEAKMLPPIRSYDFELVVLGDGAVLLTYISAHADARGDLHRRTLRSSIWIRTRDGWQMRFHQGTPVHSPLG